MITGRLHYLILLALESLHVGILLLIGRGEGRSMVEGSHTDHTVIIEVLMVGILGLRVKGFGHLVEVVIILGKEVRGNEEPAPKLVLQVYNSYLPQDQGHDGEHGGIRRMESEHVVGATLNIDGNDTP